MVELPPAADTDSGCSRPPYQPELRAQLVTLAQAGRTPEQLAAEFEASAQIARNWVDQAAVDEGAAQGQRAVALTTAERAELASLRRENRQLKVERDILATAAAWSARETGTIPSGSSGA